MRKPSRPDGEDLRLADRLHSFAIHLLRRLREADRVSSITPAQLSALSVIVYQGPVSLKDLAAAEQVTPPTMSRIVRLLEGVGLVQRLVDPNDRRALGLLATAEGRRVLQEGRGERLRILAKGLDRLSSSEKQVVSGAISILERILVKP